jgi:hypothetical protein
LIVTTPAPNPDFDDDDAPTEEWVVDDQRPRVPSRTGLTAIEEVVERAVRRALASKPHDTAVSSAGRKEASCRDDEATRRGSLDPRGSRPSSTGEFGSTRRKRLTQKIERLTNTIERRLTHSKQSEPPRKP